MAHESNSSLISKSAEEPSTAQLREGGAPGSSPLPAVARAMRFPAIQAGLTALEARPETAPFRLGFEIDSHGAKVLSDALDRSLRAGLSRFTSGLSPAALGLAFWDWATHLAASPGKQMQLSEKAVRKSIRLWLYMNQCALSGGQMEPCIEPLPQDRRFDSPAWRFWPYNLIYQNFLLSQQWWHVATTDVHGVTKQHENVVDFTSRQILDMFSPSNYLLTNPEIAQRTAAQGGMNLVRGALNFFEDVQRWETGKKPRDAEKFQVGRDVAATPGKVIFRNRLIELIQYEPATDKVRPEPILIVPAWIMKYYILDLSPHNSLVKYLVSRGFTVFMISWKNPGSEDRELGMEDYRKLGVMAALDAIAATVPGHRPHAIGYCIGGTLLAIAAAAMARDGEDRLKTVTLFAAQTDFTEAGELMLFINESQLAFLEDMMWEQGFLDARQMAGAFQLLRSNDLVWSRVVKDYLMGEHEPLTDLMAWNLDATRMPYRMHSQYLRRLFLNNDLAEVRYLADGAPVALADIRVPTFAVGTTRDHVAPWRSVFKIHLLTDTDVTFVLTSGGHNAGIVSEPGHRGRTYQILTREAGNHYLDPDAWTAAAPKKEGSWWPEFVTWLEARSGEPVAPPMMGAAERGYRPLIAAPGVFILQE